MYRPVFLHKKSNCSKALLYTGGFVSSFSVCVFNFMNDIIWYSIMQYGHSSLCSICLKVQFQEQGVRLHYSKTHKIWADVPPALLFLHYRGHCCGTRNIRCGFFGLLLAEQSLYIIWWSFSYTEYQINVILEDIVHNYIPRWYWALLCTHRNAI